MNKSGEIKLTPSEVADIIERHLINKGYKPSEKPRFKVEAKSTGYGMAETTQHIFSGATIPVLFEKGSAESRKAETPAKSVFIFRISHMIRPDSAEGIKSSIEEQIKTGVVLLDPMVAYIGREIIVDGEEVEIVIKNME